LAERLLADATASPALIGRSDPIDSPRDEQSARLSTLALLSDPALDVRPYLDELVTVAIAAARVAEDLSEEVRVSSRKAGRQTLLFGCLSAVGLLFGATGFAASISSEAKLAQIRTQVAALQDQQRQAQAAFEAHMSQLAGSRVAQLPMAADNSGPHELRMISSVPPALKPPNVHYVAQPWPDSRPNARQVAVERDPRATSPDLFSGLGRGIHTIFP
jgi:hypothetical protein